MAKWQTLLAESVTFCRQCGSRIRSFQLAPDSAIVRTFTATLLLTLSGSACALRQPEAELALMYNEAAKHHSPDRNPIIAIPGLMGSRLLDVPSGVSAWGAFERGAANPASSEGARMIALRWWTAPPVCARPRGSAGEFLPGADSRRSEIPIPG